MDIKLIEIRDRGTFIPAMAIRLRNRTPEEFFLLRRAGYGAEEIGGPEESPGVLAHGREPYIVLAKLVEVEAHYDAFLWRNPRTMGTAHRELIANWEKYQSGDVLDVRFVLGEQDKPAVSESMTVYR